MVYLWLNFILEVVYHHDVAEDDRWFNFILEVVYHSDVARDGIPVV